MYNSWQCGVGSGSPVIMNSAGSCDSMISINSGYSDDSMEHLSPEERACLMFLEETIESLEVEDDSGLSNDEPERPPLPSKTTHLSSSNQTELLDHDDPNRILRKDHKLKNLLVPTPLVIANGNANLVKKPALLAGKPNSPALKSFHSTNFLTSGPPRSPSSPGAPPKSPSSPAVPPKSSSSPVVPPRSPSGPGISPRSQSSPGVPPRSPLSSDISPRSQSSPGVPPRSPLSSDISPRSQSSPGVPPRSHLSSDISPRSQSSPVVPPRSPLSSDISPRSSSMSKTPESNGELADLPPSFIPRPPIKSGFSSGTNVKENPSTSYQDPDQRHKMSPSQMVMELLPPPSDFMDGPGINSKVSPLQTKPGQPQASSQLQPQFQKQSLPQGIKVPHRSSFVMHEVDGSISPTTSSPRGMLTPSTLENFRKKASIKGVPDRVPVPVVVPPAQKVPNQAGFSMSGQDVRSAHTVDSGEPKSPPAVAPKPKKLPSSIVLKNHKDVAPGHSLVSPGDRVIMNQQKVHTEALKKLGLLKGDEPDSLPSLSPPHRVSPRASFNASTHAAPPSVQDSIPAVLTESPLPIHPKKGSRESLLIAKSPSQKPFEMKSATLERPRTDPKSLTLERSNPSRERSQHATSSMELLPGELRKNRSASAGSRKDFGNFGQLPSNLNREPEIRTSRNSLLAYPPVQLSTESQQCLRSHGISVVISPQNKQALKKLGLMKD